MGGESCFSEFPYSLRVKLLTGSQIRNWVFDEFKGGSGIPKEGEAGDDDIWKRWRKFAEAIEDRKSIKETTSDAEHYKPLYKRYADNIAQSELAKSIRSGRGVV